mgnify:CR=1 FL=1
MFINLEKIEHTMELGSDYWNSLDKAKELRIVAEKFITKASKNTLSNQRLLAKVLSSQITKKLITEIAPKYISRQGGYTRIIKLGPRKSDGANMVIIELVK